jgi:hypothetical protein
MIFSTLFVLDMAKTYGNDEMVTEYQATPLNNTGSNLYNSVSNNVSTMKNETSGGIIPSFSLISGILTGVGTVLSIIFLSPVYFANAIGAILSYLPIPDGIVLFIQGAISIGLYILIIFVIISARLQGGKV